MGREGGHQKKIVSAWGGGACGKKLHASGGGGVIQFRSGN